MGFFDKLKKEVAEKPIETTKKSTKAVKTKIKPAPATVEPEIEVEEPFDTAQGKKPKRVEKESSEGELAIDLYETDTDFVVKSTIAGIKPEDLDITVENDIITIRGERKKQIIEEAKKHYYEECYWGAFSRQIILPEEVDGSKAEASIKDGVLTLKIPKVAKILKRKISIKQESS